MDSGNYLLPVLMALASAAGALSMAFNLRRARTIEDTPTAKIRSAAQGYVELNGFARADTEAPLLAPLTGKPCLWYRYSIESYQRGGKNSRWQTIESGTSERLFLLDDSTGHCHVDPRRAEVSVLTRQSWQGRQRHPLQPGGSVLGQLFGGNYRYTEQRIEADDWLYVLGWFETLHAPGPAQQAQARMKTLLNTWKQDRDALLARFDRNGDGELDLQEWEQARQAATREAHHYALQQPAPIPVNTIGIPPLRDRPFLIATRDPQHLARHYRRNAGLSLLIGLGIAALIAWQAWSGT